MHDEAKKRLESRMLRKLHVRFGVGVEVQSLGLHHVKVEPRSNNAIAAGLSSFQGTKHHQKLDVARHPEKSKPTQKKLRAKDRPLANDFVTDEAFDELLDAWFGNIARVLLPGRAFYMLGRLRQRRQLPAGAEGTGLYLSQAIIWDKQHPVLTRKDFMGAHEWCFYLAAKGQRTSSSARTTCPTCGTSRR